MFIYLIVFLSVAIAAYLKNYLKSVYLALIVQGPFPWPIIGNSLLLTNNPILKQHILKFCSEPKSIITYWLSIIPMFLISEPDDIKVILSSSKHTDKNIFYDLLHNFIGKGLLTNSGHKWKYHRKLIQPLFHINILKTFIPRFTENTKQLIDDLKYKKDVNFIEYVNHYVLNVLHESVLGISGQDSKNSPFRMGENNLPYRVNRPWLLFESLFKYTDNSKRDSMQKDNLKEYTRKVLQMKKEQLGQSASSTKSLLEMFIEIGDTNTDFTDEDIIDEAITFMLAGQDSVGTSIVYTLYFLAKYPEHQEIVKKELECIFDKSPETLTLEDLNEMVYLEQCIKEATRLCPSIPVMARKIREETKIGRYTFPPGSNILISAYMTHRLPHHFPNPNKFHPSRFSTENVAKMHRYAYLAFNAGPRNCIGFKYAILEMKVVISQLLRHYQVSLTPGFERFTLWYRVALKTKGGVWLRFTERTCCNNKSSN